MLNFRRVSKGSQTLVFLDEISHPDCAAGKARGGTCARAIGSLCAPGRLRRADLTTCGPAGRPRFPRVQPRFLVSSNQGLLQASKAGFRGGAD